MNGNRIMWIVLILTITLFLIGVMKFITHANNEIQSYKDNNTHYPYEIIHYTDTINENIILTTVCYYENKGYISVSTLKLN